MKTLSIAFVLAIQGCAMERTVSATQDSRPCVVNYSTEGSFWSGKQFKTFEDFPKMSKARAVDSLVAAIASNGLQITSSSKDLGLVSAHVTVGLGGAGKTVPLNAVVKNNSSGGVRVELVFALSGTLSTSADSVQSNFCNILASVNQSERSSTPTPEVVAPKEATKSKAKKAK
jgi:hypothetical protein